MKRSTIHFLVFLFVLLAGTAVFSAAQETGTGPFRQEGIASWYGKEYDGKVTAYGEIFNSGLYTAAHPTLPLNTYLTVTNKQNNRKVTVRVNDKGPFVSARIIDLSRAAAEALDMVITGTAPVILEIAVNTALGPAGTGEPPAAQAVPVPARSPVQIIQTAPAVTADTGIVPAPVPQPAQRTPVAASPATVPVPAYIPVPPAVIKGGIPPAESSRLYRLQVGAYTIPRNVNDALSKLKKAGLNPGYESQDGIYRVVLAGLKAADIPLVAQMIADAGFPEALIREETGF